MRVKKILLALCILLLAFPSWAASRVIQGDAQFVYSQEIDEAVNPKIGEEQEFAGFGPEGEPIYTTIPIYKYTSITSPTVTLGNVATIFPLNLGGMVFNVSYSSVSGKPGIYPGVFTFQFSKSEILMLPNGAVIMDEIENSTSPVDVLFKYFDPVFVIYGTDGDKVSINVKNFPLNFSFITGSYEDMAISFPVVLADGYPDTFCIEQVNGYLFVYDAMVSQENAGVISDGKIEVAFALVPNERATDVARQDFPILELNGEKGYVIFDDPSEYLSIPEMVGVSSAIVSSGNTFFTNTENGFSFAVNTEPERNATFVQCAVLSEKAGTLHVNGYPLETEEVLLPDGTRYLTASFVLINGSFTTGAFVSNDTVYIFDGLTNDVFTATVAVRSSSEGPLLSTSNINLKKADLQIDRQEADAAFELAEATPWPGKEGVLAAIHVGSFVGTYEGTGKYVPLEVTISLAAETLRSLSQSGYDAALSIWEEDPYVLFNYFHIYKQVGDLIYDLVMVGGRSAFTVSGDPAIGINISFRTALVDDVGFIYFDDSASAFVIYDGNPDGKLVDPLFIGVLQSEIPESKPEQPVLSSPGVSLKLTNIDTSLLGLEEAEADFEYLGLTDWPGKEGVLNAISVGSFEGEYDGTGRYVPLKMEVSVSSYDLERLSKDRHAKIISKWSEDKTVFLDYFHVYKQVGDLIYDLVLMGGKNAFTVSGDPTTRVTISFPAVLIDDVGNTYYDEIMGFVIYDGNPDGKLVDPLFVGAPEQIPVEEGEEEPKDEEETKHILPDNPTGSSMGNDDLKDWIKVFSLF